MMAAGSILTVVSGLAAIGTAGTGWRAAALWLRASAVQADPGWGPKNPEPGIPELQQMAWTVALLKAGAESGALNARAARWTATAVILAAVQSAAGFLASALAQTRNAGKALYRLAGMPAYLRSGVSDRYLRSSVQTSD